ncbi:MAG: putative addiction module antidote protein [Acinetobacter sp.]|nr:putative addiction module antidote protein [Acinetobacter sp.]
MKTTKFNAFDYFETHAEIMEYLDSCFNDDDPELFVVALSHLIEKKGVAEVAKLTGLNRESLYKTIKGQTQPSWATVHKIIQALKLNAHFSYV